MLGPVVGPIGRVVTGGRVWEGFGVDPYLAGALAYETVQGTQSVGVGTSTKVSTESITLLTEAALHCKRAREQPESRGRHRGCVQQH